MKQNDISGSSLLGPMLGPDGPGMLTGVRVVEVADELGEYCGMLLAGLGAEVVKVEPPRGNSTRAIGPFLDDKPDPNGSLFFWNYNRGKRSVVIDLETEAGIAAFHTLLAGANILLDSSCGDLVGKLGESHAALRRRYPGLITARLTPFGDEGPWADFKGSDLIHLALGGIMMNCGYDTDPTGRYDLPPIAPQFWHAYSIAGEQLAVGITAALIHWQRTGEGQDVSCAVHEAVSKNTELDLMSWVMRRIPLYRQTCRHAAEKKTNVTNIAHTKDGRWVIAYGVSARDRAKLVPFLERYGMAEDLKPPASDSDMSGRAVPGSSGQDAETIHAIDVLQRFVRSYRYEDLPWRDAQDAGLLWAPLRKPHENAEDEHWLARGTYADIEHPELGRSFRYPVSKWLSTNTSWKIGTRAPLLGEHTQEELDAAAGREPPVPAAMTVRKEGAPTASQSGKPFALRDVKIFDFSWFLASAGGTRFLAALGAECLKVEWKENPDTRMAAMAPIGGRDARRNATGPLPGVRDLDMGGQFNNKNSGKLGLSLNIRNGRGLEIAKELISQCDIVAEGFSPGVLERLGLGYDVLKQIKPDIIYIQQSGMGNHGTYGRMRTVGPVAAAFAGASEMSGLPEPAMPAGWGYSYLDWVGAYSFSLALLGALYHRDRTGEGQWIDASQCESGLFLSGPAILDWSANKRPWSRYGNRSPYKKAAPHGAFRCAGDDRWIAIGCFDDHQWRGLARVADHPEWIDDPRFATLDARLAHQEVLERLVGEWTATQDAYACMEALQRERVPAGVCQTAEDRCDRDPQLSSLEWLTEVTGTKIGTWPVIEFPVKLSATPAHSGGPIHRGAPGYGEDNARILKEYLGLSPDAVAELAREGVL
jgi:crotonobetainyl-CoA:carnitine CoA-transferase CaiB-like acyl-CoA transferase